MPPSINQQWFFRPRPKGDPIKEGVNNFAFKISIDTLVRESVQNVNDQRVGEFAEVHFVLEEFSGASLDRLLEMIGWDAGLKSHLLAISKGESHLRPRAERALAAVKKGSVRALLIRDLDCRGLEGEEDGRTGNFVMLCRHELVTDSESKKLRGGAFGIGKSVLWAYSDASTVVFSSLPFERATKNSKGVVGEPRFFGRSYLVSHEFGADRTWHNGDGTFGEMVTEAGDKWSKSVRSAKAKQQVRATLLDRDWKRTGTSILIPFLDNPRLEKEPSVEQTIVEIRDAVQKWFWPALADGLLQVKVGVRKGSAERLEEVRCPSWAALYTRAEKDGAGRTKVDDSGMSASQELDVAVPRRTEEPIHDAASASVRLSVTRIADDERDQFPEALRSTVAFVRGARMVVEYHSRSGFGYLPPFVGVARAGNWNGSSIADSALEMLLRDSEPPAHDKWDPNFEKLGLHYASGAKAAVRNFIDAVDERVRTMLGASRGDSGKPPRGLAERLRSRGRGKKQRTEKFQVDKDPIVRVNPQEVPCRARVKRLKGSKAWRVSASAALVDEQTTQLRLVHDDSRFVVTPSNTTVVRDFKDGILRGYVIDVPAHVDEVEISLVGLIDNSVVGRRSMVDMRVVPSEIRP